MTDVQQRAAAKQFVKDWTGRGYEKGDSQPFWLALLNRVYGVENPDHFISFEDQIMLDHTSFIDGSIQTTFVKGENYLLFSYFHRMGYELQSVRFMGAVVNHVNTTKNKKFIKKTWTLHFTKSRSNFIMRMRTCRSCDPRPGRVRCPHIP